MKNWISRNLRNIIATAFVIPILLVAFVSISHVTTFYGLSNPMSWAIYLSVAIEIAALSALAAVSVRMGRFVYLPFFVVTLIQMIGNIFFSFSYIDETGQTFQDWVNMVGGLFENMGIEKTDINTHKTIIAFFSGGLLPIISLTFAHMLVLFTEKNQVTDQVTDQVIDQVTNHELTTEEARRIMDEKIKQEEEIRYKPTEEDLQKLEKVINVIKHEPEEVSSEPITPTQEDLDKLQDFLNKQYVNNVVEKNQEELTDENIEVQEEIQEPQEIINTNESPTRSLRYVSQRIYGR